MCLCAAEFVFGSCHSAPVAVVIITPVYIITICLQCQQRGVDLVDKRKEKKRKGKALRERKCEGGVRGQERETKNKAREENILNRNLRKCRSHK